MTFLLFTEMVMKINNFTKKINKRGILLYQFTCVELLQLVQAETSALTRNKDDRENTNIQ